MKTPKFVAPSVTEKDKLKAVMVLAERYNCAIGLDRLLSAMDEALKRPYVLEYTYQGTRFEGKDENRRRINGIPVAALVAVNCEDGVIRFGYSAVSPYDKASSRKVMRLVAATSALLNGDKTIRLPNSVAKRYNAAFVKRIKAYFDVDNAKMVTLWPITSYSERVPGDKAVTVADAKGATEAAGATEASRENIA